MHTRLTALAALSLGLATSFATAQTSGPNDRPVAVEKSDTAMSAITSEEKPVLLAKGFRFTEGPLWHNGELYFCDLSQSIVYKWSPTEDTTDDQWEGSAKPFIPESDGAAGLAIDINGNMLVTQFGSTLSKADSNGKLTVLARDCEGKPLGSVNDLAVRKDGMVFFTNPSRGGTASASGVYSMAQDGTVTLVVEDTNFPNGTILSLDQKTLYYSQYAKDKIYAITIDADGKGSDHRLFCDMSSNPAPGSADGMAIDLKGNIYATGPGGVWVIDSEGKQIGIIPMPRGASNCCLGGPDGKTLFITSGSSVYRIATLIGTTPEKATH